MKKREIKKLSLSRETLRSLESKELREAVAAGTSQPCFFNTQCGCYPTGHC